MKVQEIREKFVQFFESKNHIKYESSPLIPQNDPTLLFANAGMNQFKDFFTGKANPNHKRAVTIQKCVRAGGKHNDLENVGLTARHHTFFEMLGNFSFGDYFKEEAIVFAWEFLTDVLKIPKDKLFITVHHSDDEALEIWHQKIGIPKNKIFKKGDKDNFWEMGDTGPCGPCTEIFYDHGPDHSTPGLVLKEGQDILEDELRYVEIWNLVFMQFEKSKEGIKPLPNPSIDTGAGLERIAAVLQGKYWNYDTDAFTPIIKKIEDISGKKYTEKESQSSFRVVSDHIRSATMLITDGVIPSNEGRGYVLRRIIRRAVRHLRLLNAPDGSFCKIVPAVFETLGKEYPQNKTNSALAEKLLLLEEKKFLETLDLGLKYLNESLKKDVLNGVFKGDAAFKLYDTYGFPLDLTELILQEQGLKVDTKAFDSSMLKRKEDSKKSWKATGQVDNKIFFEAKEKCGETQFTGYQKTNEFSKLLYKIDLGENTALIFDKTPFYGESGGQAGDSGNIKLNGNLIAHISDTQKPVENLFVHICDTDACELLEISETYELQIDIQRRELTKRNHSATHLLQSALIEVLGKHVKQAGSSVDFEKLRFDFTHMQAVSAEELQQVEELVNQKINSALEVNANIMTKDEAIHKGALALFGEKYGDNVRVLTMGDFSTELCGGTHVDNTKEISLFVILSESSLSTGVRRIEATTSDNAFHYLTRRSRLLGEIERLANAKDTASIDKFNYYIEEVKNKSKEIAQLKDKLQSSQSDELFSNPQKIGDFVFVSAIAPEGADSRKISDIFMDKNNNGILLLFGQKGDKQSILIRRPKDLKTIHCGNILKSALELIGGRGGGKPELAQGSGELGGIEVVTRFVKKSIEEAIIK